MKILLVAATDGELLSLLDDWIAKAYRRSEKVYQIEAIEVDVLITGPGILHTAFALGSHLRQFRYDLLLNIGIGGAIDRQLQIGDVVHVISEQIGDLGAEDQDGSFLSLFDLSLLKADDFPFVSAKLKNPKVNDYSFLPVVNGLTVNKVHGSAQSIGRLKDNFPNVQVESMEGAAFFFAALQYEIPFLEIRSISNYVEPRNRDDWRIDLALTNLHQVVNQLLGILQENRS